MIDQFRQFSRLLGQLNFFSLSGLAGVFMFLQFIPGLFIVTLSQQIAIAYFQIVSLGLLCFFIFVVIGQSYSLFPHTIIPSWGGWQSPQAFWLSLFIIFFGFVIKLRHCGDGQSLLSACDVDAKLFLGPNILHRLGCIMILIIIFSRQSTFAVRLGQILGITSCYILFSIIAGVGRFEIIATMVSIGTIIWYQCGNRFRAPLIFILFLIISALFLFKTFIKYSENLSPNEMVDMTLEKLIISGFLSRISQHEILLNILQRWDTEMALGLFGWEDFIHALFGMPTLFFDGNDFGKAFGLLFTKDFVTGVGPTFLGNFYLIGGIPSVVIGMSILGLCYGWFSRLMHQSRNTTILLLYASLLPTLIHGLEDWIFFTFARVIQIATICLLIAWLVNLFDRDNACLSKHSSN